jgi:hypothetical protein
MVTGTAFGKSSLPQDLEMRERPGRPENIRIHLWVGVMVRCLEIFCPLLAEMLTVGCDMLSLFATAVALFPSSRTAPAA